MYGGGSPCDAHYLYIGIPRAVTASVIMYPDYPAHVSADIEMFSVFIVVHINITGTYVTKYMIYYHNYTGYRCMNILFTRVWEAYYTYMVRGTHVHGFASSRRRETSHIKAVGNTSGNGIIVSGMSDDI